MPRGRRRTELEKVQSINTWDVKNDVYPLLLVAFCIACKVLTPAEANRCKTMDTYELKHFVREKKLKRIEELGCKTK